MSGVALIDITQVKGGKAVVDQVNNLVAKSDVVTTEKAGVGAPADDKVMSEAAVVQRLEMVQAGFSRQAEDEVMVEGAQATTEFNTSCVPTDDKLAMSVNGVVYVEDKHFTVDRASKKITWTYTAANGGFDLNEALADSVKFVYLTREPAAPIMRTHVLGMVLAQEGDRTGTWVRVDRDFNTVEFDAAAHGTWAGIKQVMNDTYGSFVEIPVTYVKTETLTDGPYAGKNCWWIADGPVEGFHVHPAFIGQDGQPHNLQIASYIASNKSGTPYSEDKGTAADSYWNSISYDDVHAKGWMTGNARPYSIYDHHFLARMMLTEFGKSDVQAQTVNGVSWYSTNRINYHGIYDPFGTPDVAELYWLDGMTTLNGTYQVLAADGSRNMIETGISCLGTGGRTPINCHVDQINGINFGDIFIASSSDRYDELGSFADYQYLRSGRAFYVYWGNNDLGSSSFGAFFLADRMPTSSSTIIGWRLALCGSPMS